MKKTTLILIFTTTLLVGLMNTVLIRAEDVGSWKNYVGYLFLLIAMINFILLVKAMYYKKKLWAIKLAPNKRLNTDRHSGSAEL